MSLSEEDASMENDIDDVDVEEDEEGEEEEEEEVEEMDEQQLDAADGNEDVEEEATARQTDTTADELVGNIHFFIIFLNEIVVTFLLMSDSFRTRRTTSEKAEASKESLSEAEMAMMAAKKRHQEEEAAKLQSYEEQRRVEREKIEKELRELKEKQEFRRKHREEEEREFAERLHQEEQRRLKEEAERRAKHEAEARRRGEERRKRLERMGNVTALSGQNDGPNYIIPKSPGLKQTPVHPETKRKETNLQERAEAKQAFLNAIRNQKRDVSNATFVDLKQTILALHDQIIRSEAEKYDLEKRLEIHEYDLKELTERQKQVTRHRALAQGLDPNEALNSKYPPKISVASKFDRQVDRRPFNEIRDIYENPAVARAPLLARGTARPPPEWGRKSNEELDMVRKNLDQPRYVEVVKIENAKPPLTPIPLTLPSETSGFLDE